MLFIKPINILIGVINGIAIGAIGIERERAIASGKGTRIDDLKGHCIAFWVVNPGGPEGAGYANGISGGLGGSVAVNAELISEHAKGQVSTDPGAIVATTDGETNRC